MTLASAPVWQRSRQSVATVGVALLWVAGVCLIFLVGSLGGTSSSFVQGSLGLAGLAHSGVGFWQHGGSRVSAPGIALFGSGIFIFFPAFYCATVPGAPYAQVDMSHATVIALMAQLILYHIFWRPQSAPTAVEHRMLQAPRSALTLLAGLLLLGFGIVMSTGRSQELNFSLAESAAYVGVVLVAVWAFQTPERISWSYIFVGGAFLLYMELVFSGFGRLRLGSLGLAIALLAAHRWRGRTVKTMLLLAMPPALGILAQARVDFITELRADRAHGETGLESVLLPMVRFSELLSMDQDDILPHSYGSSFLAALVLLVPRELWPGKPVGLGADLAQLFRPELAGTGHTELALLHGELIHAFGLAGLVLLIPLLGLFARWVDTALVTFQYIDGPAFSRAVLTAVIVIVAASFLDFIWGGTFNYGSRVAPRLLVLGFLLLPALVGVLQNTSAWRTRRFTSGR